ncbi:MAG: acyl--CoA ligase [Desulfobacterales bacterium]|nr:acyl--CoA ligase [Desulfobacterales bacterium]
MNIGSIFSRHAKYRPNHPAVIVKEHRLTHFQFNFRINQLANGLLGLGLQKGDKVATLLPNCLELLEIYWACAKTGIVVVPLSTMLRANAIQSLINDANAKIVFLNSDFISPINESRHKIHSIQSKGYILVDGKRFEGFGNYSDLTSQYDGSDPDTTIIKGSDLFNIMYSSGTTGLPKGIMLTHDIRIMYGACFASAFRITPESIVLHAGAVIFNGAFVDLMPAVFSGSTYILLESFDPQTFIETIRREKVTHVMMVPAQIVAMLNHPSFSLEKLSSLEMILSLGAPLMMESKEELTTLLPGIFYELYGLTEGFVTILDKYDYPEKPRSVGTPTPLFELKIMDEQGMEVASGQVGEICGKGPIQMTGYHNRPDLTKKAVIDGWLHSGDLGYVDEDGFLYLVDRKKDMIVSGGVNVYPKDIEEIAIKHPCVNEVAVFGILDEKWGETPCAAVTLLSGKKIKADELKLWINSRVDASFQRLAKVVTLDEFPRNVAGKVLKRELRKTHK